MSTDSGSIEFHGLRPFMHGEESTYYEYCQRGELRIQFCPACQRHIFYPRALCPYCLNRSLEWVEASGMGTVYTFTIQHRATPPFSDEDLPHVIAIIELDESVRMLSRVFVDPETIVIGMRVKAVFADVKGDHKERFRVPVFVAAAAQEDHAL